LIRRRAFYDIKLHDWIVRHDLHADGNILKTVHSKGVGYARPTVYDDMQIDLKVYQTKPDSEEQVVFV